MSLLTNLISYWKLDETSAGAGAITRVDSHGSNDLTDVNTTPSGTGKINNACDFTFANTEYLAITDNSTLDLTTAMSISCWINIDNAPSAEEYGIISKWEHGSQNSWIVRADKTTGDEIQCFVADALNDVGNNHAITQSANLSVDTWYHLVILYDGGGVANADRFKIYVNNSAQTLTFGGTIPASLTNSSSDLRIGNLDGTLAAQVFDGLIDEVGLWSKVLTTAEITKLYNSGNGLPYSKFNEGAFLVFM